MPKERRDRSVSRERYRASPYPCSSSHTKRPSLKIPSETEENVKEWEEARCPVSLEHPHNAVLLICSSFERGCRPYMCDTSYRHSNCLDQFCKSFSEEDPPEILPQEETLLSDNLLPPFETSESIITDVQTDITEEEPPPMIPISCEHREQPKLVCPLCRGEVKDWLIVEPARCFMNAKLRNCSCETCSFSGTYTDLRKHARLEHPQTRPSDADPERQRAWRSLERQRDIGDLLSTLQSSTGEDRGDDSSLAVEHDGGGWLTVFFLVRIYRPTSGSSSRSSSWSPTTRTRAQISMRRRATRLWGESYEGEAASSSREADNDSSDGGSAPTRRQSARLRQRRRTTPDNNQP